LPHKHARRGSAHGLHRQVHQVHMVRRAAKSTRQNTPCTTRHRWARQQLRQSIKGRLHCGSLWLNGACATAGSAMFAEELARFRAVFRNAWYPCTLRLCMLCCIGYRALWHIMPCRQTSLAPLQRAAAELSLQPGLPLLPSSAHTRAFRMHSTAQVQRIGAHALL
jgi:hypothetical protein